MGHHRNQPDRPRGLARRVRGHFVAALLTLMTAAVLSAYTHAGDPPARRPNIIVILSDDQGYADVGFNGCTDIPTPHLDELARGGVICKAGYVSAPVCCPSRAGLLTGRYQQRFGFEFLLGQVGAGLPPEEVTIAERLKSAGYATGAIGKWHLGSEPRFHPLEHGFDEFYGFLGGGRSYAPLGESRGVPFVPKDPRQVRLMRNHEEADDPPYLTDAFGSEAEAFIERHKDKPFFLYLAFNAVHVPLQATDKDLARFPGLTGARRTYAAMLSAMDDAVGRVTSKLRAEGLERDTLVFFLSDNGGHPMANAARNDPLRDQKGSVQEGGIRVPFVVKWPGRLPTGVQYEHPVISLDILPTALAAAGEGVPAGPALDGVDLLPYLAGRVDTPPHETLYWRYGPRRAIRQGNWKLTLEEDQPPRLYDLPADVGESMDLAAAHPQVVERLSALYGQWDVQLPAQRWRSLFDPPPRKPGK